MKGKKNLSSSRKFATLKKENKSFKPSKNIKNVA